MHGLKCGPYELCKKKFQYFLHVKLWVRNFVKFFTFVLKCDKMTIQVNTQFKLNIKKIKQKNKYQ